MICQRRGKFCAVERWNWSVSVNHSFLFCRKIYLRQYSRKMIAVKSMFTYCRIIIASLKKRQFFSPHYRHLHCSCRAWRMYGDKVDVWFCLISGNGESRWTWCECASRCDSYVRCIIVYSCFNQISEPAGISTEIAALKREDISFLLKGTSLLGPRMRAFWVAAFTMKLCHGVGWLLSPWALRYLVITFLTRDRTWCGTEQTHTLYPLL